MTKRLFISALAAGACFVGVAHAEPFSQLVAFSGALSDTGNFHAESGKNLPEPFYQNRSSNGPVAVEELARWLGLKAEPSLHLIGKPGGTNFAVADALAGGHGPHDLPAQIDAYLARGGGKADPKALYFLFIGGNDVIKAVMEMDEAKSKTILDEAVTGIETQTHRLVAAGATTIFMPDFIDVGASPALLAYGPDAAARGTRLSHYFNDTFNAMQKKIDDGSFRLIRWSFDDFVNDLRRNGSSFGLTNATEACLNVGKARCNVDHFVYLTPEYPTARVHQMLGAAMAVGILTRN